MSSKDDRTKRFERRLSSFQSKNSEFGMGVLPGGGQGGHIVPLDLDVCKNSGRFWRVDCLLFVY